MAGVWRKTLQYLGLVEDEDLEDLEDGVEPAGVRSDPAPVRRLGRAEVASLDRPEGIVRTTGRFAEVGYAGLQPICRLLKR